MTYELIKNEQHNSIEIHFDSKPSEAIRDALKKRKPHLVKPLDIFPAI